MSNHCSECGASDDDPHYVNCSSYRAPTAQEFASAEERIAELEQQVADLQQRLEAVEGLVVP